MNTFDKNWHLAQNDTEIKVTEFELNLLRVFHEFLRWQEECEKNVNDTELTGHDLALLHVIRMKDKPKTLSNIRSIINRTDTFNIQYSIKKLIKLGLIEKVLTSPNAKKYVAYRTTEKGIKNTNAYTEIRKKILIPIFNKEDSLNLEETKKTLVQLKTIYEQAANAASYITKISDEKNQG